MTEPAVAPLLAAHTARFDRRLWTVTDGVWCLVGNGLSNQTFVEGPDGVVAIDTGESVQEMTAALAELRTVTDAPVVAVIYSHFHYVGGTQAVLDEAGAVPIWSHAGVVGNRARVTGEVGPISRAGLIHQFGLTLPADGPDALVNVGLGREFRNPEHAPFTEGFVAPTDTFADPTTTTLAGLRVEMTPAPSDADDSITIWFPDLGVCVNNLQWPALFNVFAIRGEEYRDPRVLLVGFDHILGLQPDHLVATHGPPLSGRDEIREQVSRSRDAIQFLWDQTVRGINRGLTLGELADFVHLPEVYAESYFQQQLYGLAEHHVRQIHAGLRGWFDGDEAMLLPVPPAERAARLIDGFGGRGAVREQVRAALDAGDHRWALELAAWLVRAADGCEQHDRDLLAASLRRIAATTTAANVRNWCLTRARHHDGTASLDRFRTHRFSRAAILDGPAADSFHVLRVTLDPDRCGPAARHLRLELPDSSAGLHVRRGVAVPTDGGDATHALVVERPVWADVLTARRSLADVLASDDATTVGGEAEVAEFFSWFEAFDGTR